MRKLLVIPALLVILLASSCQVITGAEPELSTTPAVSSELPVTDTTSPPPVTGPMQPTTRLVRLAEGNFSYGPGSIYNGVMAALETEGGSWPPRQYLCTFDLATQEKTRVLELPDKRLAEPPAMYGRYLVWASVDAEEYMRRMTSSHFPTPEPDYDIFLLDMETDKVEQLTTEEHAQEHPVIYGDTVAWMDARNEEPDIYPPSFDIYAMDLATRQERRITENATAEGYDRLAISKSIIVWTDNRHADHGIQSHPSNSDNYNNEIYAFDLDTGKETRITDSPANDHGAAIDRDTVVWLRQETLRGGDIFAYDLDTGLETQVSSSGYAEFEPSVSGGYVVWSDARVSLGNTSNDVIMNGVQGQADVYLFYLTNGQEEKLTSTKPGQVAMGPIVSGEYVVYTVGGATNSIYVVNLAAPPTQTAGIDSRSFRSDQY
jgi:beta propeller repeat protein